MSDENYRVPRYSGLISDGPPTNSLNTNNRYRNGEVRRPQQPNGGQNNNNRRVPNKPNPKRVEQPVAGKGPKNVNVRQENLKKHKKNKFSLKKMVAIGTVVAGLATGIFFASHKKDKIQVPDQFVSTGIAIETDAQLSEVENDFTLIKLNNWKNGISDNSLGNIDFCETNKVPYGIIIESDAKNEKEAKADAAIADAILDGKDLSCPIYYDITSICDNLDAEQVSSISDAFSDSLKRDYEVGVCVSEDYLMTHDDFECEKLVVCDDLEINYTGDYTMCYFSETEEYYSNKEFSKTMTFINERGQDDIKGIDVSQYQGDVDWSSIVEQDVNFVIMRFSSFYGFHSGENLNIDDRFYEYAAACEALEIPYGIYCYSTATTVAEAKLEAKVTLEALERHGLKPDLPIYYDAETDYHFNNPEQTALLAKAFCAEVEKEGHSAGLYASYSLTKDMVYRDPSIKDMNKWVAWYKNNTQRTYDEVTQDHIPDVSEIGKYNAVQVTDKAIVQGIKENTVDVNFANDSIGRIR